MPLSRDEYKAAMREAIDTGGAAGEMWHKSRWQKLTLENVAAKQVLRSQMRLGLEARDVLDLMEEYDGT